MGFYIDFNSEEAIYIQLCNQIIFSIATDKIKEGDSLPSVRQMAEEVGINMHTVNKAYGILRQKGLVKLDRRRGAVIAIDTNKQEILLKMKEELALVIARGICNGVCKEEAHRLIDELYDDLNISKR